MFGNFKLSLNNILLSAVLIAFPLSIIYTNIIIIILLLYVIATLEKEEVKDMWSNRYLRTALIINILPFLFIILTLLYSPSVGKGLKAIEKYLSLLIFPFIFMVLWKRVTYEHLLRTFAFVILAMAGICIAFALYNFLFVPPTEHILVGDSYNQVISRWNVFSNTSLMEPLSISPIHMALFVSFAMFIVLLDKKLPLYVRIVLVFFLFIFQFLAGSRIGLIALFVAGFVFLFFLQRRSKYFRMIVIGLPVILITAFSLIASNPILKKRYLSDFVFLKLPDEVSGWNGINIRHAIWKCSMEVYSKSPFLGYGVGSLSEPREECYKNYSFYGPFGTDMNSHNQYFEYALIGGIPLLILFIWQLAYSVKVAISNGNGIYLLFLVLFIITCIGESLLERHKGLVFFSYFNSLFIFNSLCSKKVFS